MAKKTGYPTPYRVDTSKFLPCGGRVVIEGPVRSSVKEADKGQRRTRKNYRKSGGWGGPN